jgi:serine/threonine-protein kinase
VASGVVAMSEAPKLPELSSRYELLRKIGAGGMAEVYEARHLALGRRVAIKLLSPAALERPSMRERFEREAHALARVQSPHVVSVLDLGHAGDRPFIVMELLEGRDLRQIVQERARFAVRRAVTLVRQACWGMAAAHAEGIVHRDLKPENLFVVQPRVGPELCKVIDFGVARAHDASRTLTREGALVGTVRYMAPEQALGEAVDERVDVHALGLILYELLSGRAAFTADHERIILFRIMNEPPPALGRVRADAPVGLGRVLERALAKRPDDRVASVVELARLLEPFEGREPTALEPSSERHPSSARSVEAADPTARLGVATTNESTSLSQLRSEIPKSRGIGWGGAAGLMALASAATYLSFPGSVDSASAPPETPPETTVAALESSPVPPAAGAGSGATAAAGPDAGPMAAAAAPAPRATSLAASGRADRRAAPPRRDPIRRDPARQRLEPPAPRVTQPPRATNTGPAAFAGTERSAPPRPKADGEGYIVDNPYR